MKASFKNIDKIFEFKGLWGISSKCGLKIHQKEGKYIVLVSELYQDNPGTSVTQASCLLAKQICEEHYGKVYSKKGVYKTIKDNIKGDFLVAVIKSLEKSKSERLVLLVGELKKLQ